MMTTISAPQRKNRDSRGVSPNGAYEPSPEEIRAMCVRIQAEWTENERQKRLAVPEFAWTVPGAPDP